MEILLTIALFIAFFFLLKQEKALGKYAQSTTLFTLAVDEYQEAVEGYQEAIAEYQEEVEGYQEAIEHLKQEIAEHELLLKEHGIEKPKPTQQLIPPPPPQFNSHKQRQPKSLERDRH
jgi:cell shape-determining protein MreC